MIEWNTTATEAGHQADIKCVLKPKCAGNWYIAGGWGHCWSLLPILYTHGTCALTVKMFSRVDSLLNLIRLTWKLISFLFPLSSVSPLLLLWPSHGSETHTHTHPHTRVQCMTHCTLPLSIVSSGVKSPPHQAGESVLSGMAEYPGPLPSPLLLRYPSKVYFCPCISLLSAKCLWRLSLL